ncbi:MAG TPA: nuclear transport factor 2 family protein [Candidatus Angelobacter sp.]|nr:nuclear transport factor 2 family protein [Candidatus Angelobacter sp.]
MRLLTMCCAVFFFMTVVSSAQEPVKPSLTPRIITATRQVTMFSGLEQQMLHAVQNKDKAALGSMLTDDCAINMPDSDAMDCADWIDSVMNKDFVLAKFVLRQMSVADLGTAAVVSYDRVQDSKYQGKPDGGEFYVIDLWKKDGNAWKLANRYVSKVGSSPYMPKGPVKPTGKG